MTAIHPSNQPWSIESDAPELSAPRKRKRRQRSGGASEDCFTCRSRATKCDRKRPYCTQCIEIGRECSGYRTTLTWDVGVASRGKLRGLSCPVVNKNVDGSGAQTSESLESRSEGRRTSPETTIKQEADTNDDVSSLAPTVSGSASTASPLPVNQLAETWPQDQFLRPPPVSSDHTHSMEDSQSQHSSLSYPTSRVEEGTFSQYDGVQRLDASHSVAPPIEQGVYTPMEYLNTSTSMPLYDNAHLSTSSAFLEQPTVTTSMNNFSEPGTSLQPIPSATNRSLGDVYDYQIFNGIGIPTAPNIGFNMPTNLFVNAEYSFLQSNQEIDTSSVVSDISNPDIYQKQISLMDSRFSNPFFHISPRLQSWMVYYNRNICPYLVAFDGFENPYRKHVLHLATDNECLQNAIAALSINNLRMRRKEIRRFGLANEITNAFRATPRDQDEPSAEELYYKQISINQLNLQLTNRQAAQDDSVLATLVVLCLFHACDTGFSKFKTQLAGVQKLLAQRDPSMQSEFIRWILVFFAWFDVMTSAVNDREMQIRGDSMDMLDFSSNLGAMEQFSGCDGRLFKLIARLSTLNLLAQGRPVRGRMWNQTEQVIHARTAAFQTASTARSDATKTEAVRSLRATDYANIDGNGWGRPIIPCNLEEYPGWEDENGFVEDSRVEFWTEWHEVRCRLQSFQIDLPNIPSASSPNAPTDPTGLEVGQRDMIHINESFRCAALLYTERLGYPSRPSSHHSFQQLVSQALYHINALGIDSCVNKFLCWPLFIIGTECVDEGHRDIIRRRCVEVTKESGFYNNVSSLEVLEKVWSEPFGTSYRSDTEEIMARRHEFDVARLGSYAQPFPWRRSMNRVDGEYIIV